MNYIDYNKLKKQLDFKPKKSRLFLHIIEDLFLLFISLYLIRSNSLIAAVVGQIALAFFYFRSFTLMHDAVHGALLENSTWNHFFGYIYASFCILPYRAWCDDHIQHHKWSGNVDMDPSMKIVKDFPKNSEFKNKIISFFWRSWIPLLGVIQYLVFWGSAFDRNKNSVKRVSSTFLQFVLIFGLLGSSSYFFGIGNIFLSLFFYLMIVEIINFPHHIGMGYRHKGSTDQKVFDQYSSARSCHYPKWFSFFALNNFNYHIEHHMFPTLPWYELLNARSLIKPILNKKYNEVQANGWILKARSKNLGSILFERII
ncbi:MAG: hypothetical protein HOO06_02540 [Bdellovibrionaceae bacterium]|nr:hypothetical protein [Pseudobdellovibrionaceae bacterium]